MPHERFFIDTPFEIGDRLSLEGTEFHHLAHVTRARPGDWVELVNGKGQLAQASLCQVTKEHAELSVHEITTSPITLPKIILAQAIPRFHRLEYILEKATELGVSEIHLFPSLLSEKIPSTENQKRRMTQITINAMKQCGRLDLPQIRLLPPLLKWEPLQGTAFFGDTDPHAPPFSSAFHAVFPCTLIIGPEKGFHPKESLFLKETLKVLGVQLHPFILRVDTAAIAALAQVWAKKFD